MRCGRWAALQLVLVALLGQSCSPSAATPLRRPPITGGHPAVGHELRLELQGAAGTKVRLEAVAGRVTLVCFGAESALTPCREALARHGDLVAAVGVGDEVGAVGGLRCFRDPAGAAARALELRGPSIVVTDRQRRIVQVIEPPDEAALEAALTALFVGEASTIHSPPR